MLKKIREMGFGYALSVALSKLVPEWMLRIGIYDIFRMPSAVAMGSSSESVEVLYGSDSQTLEAAKRLSRLLRFKVQTQHAACIAKIETQCVGSIWIASDRFDESSRGIRYDLADDQRWLFASHVKPELRGRGIYRQLKGFLIREFTDSEFFFSVQALNKRSQAANRALGAEPLLRMVSIRFLGTATCVPLRRASDCVKVHSRFSHSARSHPIRISFEPAVQDDS